MTTCRCGVVCLHHNNSSAQKPELYRAWYEEKYWEWLLFFVIFFMVYVISFWLPRDIFVSLAMTAIAIDLGSDMLDIYTTMVNQKLIDEYEKRGLECPYYEANPLLPKKLTTRQVVFSIPTLVTILTLPLVWFVPAVGFALGLGHIWASLTNRRWTRFLQQELAYYDQHRKLT